MEAQSDNNSDDKWDCNQPRICACEFSYNIRSRPPCGEKGISEISHGAGFMAEP